MDDIKVKLIPLSKGVSSIIDEEDFERVNKLKWIFNPKTGYAYRSVRVGTVGAKNKKIAIYLHRFILNISDKRQIDHKNHNKLDNRKINLRFCTDQQNHGNEVLSKNNTSGFKGVSWLKKEQKYRAYIMVNYKQIFLGLYVSKLDAAKAYNNAAIKYFGEFANVNENV